MAGDEIRMDKRVFEALASETRVDILKTLDIGQMTVTEIAHHLDMAKSSVHEHLSKMIEVGLVEKEESERKWTYYRLTSKGRQILQPHEATKILLLLGASILAFAGGITKILTVLGAAGQRAAMEAGPMLAQKSPEEAVTLPAPVPEPMAAENVSLALGLVLIAASVFIGYYAYRRWRLFRPVKFLNREF